MANGIVSRFHTLALAMEGPPKKKRAATSKGWLSKKPNQKVMDDVKHPPYVYYF